MPRDFNPYKLKRKWGRRMKKKKFSLFLRAGEQIEGRRSDFAWSKRNINPFHKADAGVSLKKKLELAVLVISIISLFAILTFHPFFHISKVSIEGLQRIDEQELRDAVEGVMDYRKFFLFPQNTYLFANVEEIRDILQSRFPIESIHVTKSFPNTLAIMVEEKISTVIYDNGKQYSYVGTDGKIVEILRNVGADEWTVVHSTVTSTNELGEEVQTQVERSRYHVPPVDILLAELGQYPIVYDSRGRESKVNAEVLDQHTVEGVIEWFNQLALIPEVPFSYIIIENELGDGIIKTEEGWELKVNLDRSVSRQISELRILLENSSFDRKEISYVDLRYPGRVYWK